MRDTDSMNRMAQTASTVASFLPARVREHIIRFEGNPPLPFGRWIEGAFMFADISGFTALSEKLAGFGKVGAEEITRIINGFMDVMLVLVKHYEGDVIKFGGDALFIHFCGEKPADRALICAKDMMTAIDGMKILKTEYGTFNFGMSLGLSYGRAFEAYLGSPERIEYLITGKAVNELAMAESAADKGEICGTENFFRVLSINEEIAKKGDFFRFDLSGGKASRDDLASEKEKSDILIVLSAAPYLPDGVMDKIYTNPWQDKMEGEHRLATVLFCNFLGYSDLLALEDEKTITQGMQTYFASQLKIIRSYGGNVNKMDIYNHGEKLMVLFGVPAAHENDPERGLLCGLDMQAAIAEIEFEGVAFKQKIGVNTGFLFSGNVGSAVRREYSVMGDAVNLSARLMGVGGFGQVLTDKGTASKAFSAVFTSAKEPVKVKGKEKPIPIEEVTGKKEKTERRAHNLFGRKAEKRIIGEVIEKAFSEGRQMISISGEAGIGKSAVLSYLTEKSEEGGWASFLGECPSYGRNMPYLPFRAIFRSILGIDSSLSNKELESSLANTFPSNIEYIPLFNAVLGSDLKETPETASLDADTRRKILHSMLVAALKDRLKEKPLLITVEDAQWADESSLNLVDEITSEVSEKKIIICLVHRPELDIRRWCRSPWFLQLEIGAVGEEALNGMISHIIGSDNISKELIRLVGEKTQRNPLFIEEFIKTLKEKNVLVFTDEEWSLKGNIDEMDIPDSVHGVIMARIDSLGEKPKQALQTASVLGRVFPVSVFNGVVKEDLSEDIRLLEEHDLLIGVDDEPMKQLSFKHILTQEVAYESLLFNKRKNLHRTAGSVIEDIYGNDLKGQAEILAHHFTAGEAWENALPHLKVSGDKAKSVYSNQAALDYFSKYTGIIEEKLPRLAERNGSVRKIFLDIFLESGEILRITNRMDEAEKIYNRLFDWSSSLEEIRYQALAKNFTGQIYTTKGMFENSMKFLDEANILAEKTDDPVLLSRVEYQMGFTEYTRQNFKLACEHYLKAVDKIKLSSETKLFCDALLGLATVEMDMGNMDAVEHYLAAENIARELHDKVRLTWILSNRAVLEAKLGHSEKAIKMLEEASFTAFETQNTRFEANCAVTLAGIYFDLEDFDKVEHHSHKALKLARKIGDAFSEGYSLMTIGRADMELEKLDSAEKYLLQSLDIAEKLGDKFTESQDLIFLGYLSAEEDLKKAREMIKKGKDIAESIGMKEIAAYAYYYEALTYSKGNETAEKLMAEARSLAELSGDSFLLKRIV